MRLALKRRTGRWTASFFIRGAVLMGLLMLALNASFIVAQTALDPDVIWKQAVARNLASFVDLRDSSIIPSFAIAIAAFVVIALAHFFTIGPKDMLAKDEKDLMPWWTLWERIIHAVVLLSFLILMISGLQITYGRYLGGGSMTLFMRQLHEFAGFVYGPAVIIMMLMWVKEALPKGYDLNWFMHAGGYLGYKGEVKSAKFNAGQKVWYWVVLVCSLLLLWTGLGLFFQSGGLPQLRMYVSVHVFAAIPIILMFIIHLYLSTIGTKGVFMSMVHGKFSRSAAMKYYSEASPLKAPAKAAGSDD
jgi:formate dehydrogenase subunit gamma